MPIRSNGASPAAAAAIRTGGEHVVEHDAFDRFGLGMKGNPMIGSTQYSGLFGRRRDPEKIESMASIFIIGGFVPVAIFYAIYRQSGGIGDCAGCLAEAGWYFAGMTMGGLSLLPRRGSHLWRLAVASGAAVFVVTSVLGVPLSILNSAWSLIVLCLVGLQYRLDVPRPAGQKGPS